MALSLIEQHQILSGDAKPSIGLQTMINLAATNYALEFRSNHKILSDEVNPKAMQYLSRMLRLCNQLQQSGTRAQVVASLEQVIVSKIAGLEFTYTQISKATDAQWEGFIEAQMESSFENVSGVWREERTAYAAAVSL